MSYEVDNLGIVSHGWSCWWKKFQFPEEILYILWGTVYHDVPEYWSERKPRQILPYDSDTLLLYDRKCLVLWNIKTNVTRIIVSLFSSSCYISNCDTDSQGRIIYVQTNPTLCPNSRVRLYENGENWNISDQIHQPYFLSISVDDVVWFATEHTISSLAMCQEKLSDRAHANIVTRIRSDDSISEFVCSRNQSQGFILCGPPYGVVCYDLNSGNELWRSPSNEYLGMFCLIHDPWTDMVLTASDTDYRMFRVSESGFHYLCDWSETKLSSYHISSISEKFILILGQTDSVTWIPSSAMVQYDPMIAKIRLSTWWIWCTKRLVYMEKILFWFGESFKYW